MMSSKLLEGYGFVVDFTKIECIFKFIEKHKEFIEKELSKSLSHGSIVYLFDKYKNNPIGFVNAVNEYGYKPYYKEEVEHDIVGLVADMLHYLTGHNFITAFKENEELDSTFRVIFSPDTKKEDVPSISDKVESASRILKADMSEAGFLKGIVL